MLFPFSRADGGSEKGTYPQDLTEGKRQSWNYKESLSGISILGLTPSFKIYIYIFICLGRLVLDA